MKRYLMVGVFLAALLAVSFSLPPRIMEWRDQRRIGGSESEEAPEVVLKEQAPMTLIERLTLIQRLGQQVDMLELINGRNFTQHTIEEQVLKEFKSLAEQEIIGDLDTESLVLEAASVSLYLDLEDTEKSVMLWSGQVDTEKYYLTFQLDDESGKIVSFLQYYHGDVVPVSRVKDYDSEEDAMRGSLYGETEQAEAAGRTGDIVVVESRDPLSVEELKETAERWGNYLGCAVTDAGYSHLPLELAGEDELRFKEEVEKMMAKGYSEEESVQKIAAQWGFYGAEVWEQRCVILSDAGEEITYVLDSNSNVRLNISIL